MFRQLRLFLIVVIQDPTKFLLTLLVHNVTDSFFCPSECPFLPLCCSHVSFCFLVPCAFVVALCLLPGPAPLLSVPPACSSAPNQSQVCLISPLCIYTPVSVQSLSCIVDVTLSLVCVRFGSVRFLSWTLISIKATRICIPPPCLKRYRSVLNQLKTFFFVFRQVTLTKCYTNGHKPILMFYKGLCKFSQGLMQPNIFFIVSCA